MVQILEYFETDHEFRVSKAFMDGGLDSPFPRLRRAALNQLCDGEATISRYGIWANTVRDNIRQADREMRTGNLAETRRLMCRAANSLSAFAELQTHFDTMGIREIEIEDQLVNISKEIAREKKHILDKHKECEKGLDRDDFVWHYLLQSFSTMGRASGWHGLIENKDNYNQLLFSRIEEIPKKKRLSHIESVCRRAKIRMPFVKAKYILRCHEQIEMMGGMVEAKNRLLTQPGRGKKIKFLMQFHGIGEKYARNIMMDVYHPDFRDSIAIDARITKLSEKLGLSFNSYEEHEQFYLRVAKKAGLTGWELDRLIFNFQDSFLNRLQKLR